MRRMGERECPNAATSPDSALVKAGGGVLMRPRVRAAGFALSCTLLCGLGVPVWVLPCEKCVMPWGERAGSTLCGLGVAGCKGVWVSSCFWGSLLAAV